MTRKKLRSRRGLAVRSRAAAAARHAIWLLPYCLAGVALGKLMSPRLLSAWYLYAGVKSGPAVPWTTFWIICPPVIFVVMFGVQFGWLSWRAQRGH